VVYLGFSRAYPAIGKKTKNLPKPNKELQTAFTPEISVPRVSNLKVIN
jgi:hypothetical protein